ncbi:MAG TPA: nucleotidyltransferase family protein [Polyangiaceae bacterium]
MKQFSVTKPVEVGSSLARMLTVLKAQPGGRLYAHSVKLGHCWPTANQQWLLKTLFLPDNEAASAWRAWRDYNDPDLMDVPSMRLVPQLYRRLRALGIDDVWLPRFKGAYKKTWTNNQRLLLHTLPALSSFEQIKVSAVALKGFAVTLKYLGADFGLRSMFDLDLLVPSARAIQIVNHLVANGWHLNANFSVGHLKQHALHQEHAREFTNGLGHADLHWHMLHQDPTDFVDDWVRGEAKPFTFRGHRFQVPSPTALLLHVCLHGVRYCSIPSVMWAADALTVVQAAPSEIDWRALVALAQRRRLVLPVLDSLSFLESVVKGTVPREVLGELRQSRTSRIEELEYEALVTAPSRRSETLAAAMRYMVLLRQRQPAIDPDLLLSTRSNPRRRSGARPAEKGPLTRALGVRARW